MNPLNNFETDVLNSDTPVLVDFYADWCGPCKALAPKLQALSEQHGDTLKVVKVNIEDHQDLAREYGIRGVPTLMTFKGGEKIDTHVGMANDAKLQALVGAL